MRKALTLLGKALIIFSMLWPIPFGFLSLLPDGWKLEGYMPIWGVNSGKWWILALIMLAGISLCLLAKYRSQYFDSESSKDIKRTTIGWFAKIWVWCVIGTVSFFIIVTAIALIIRIPWWLFLLIIGIAVWVFGSVMYYRNYNKKDE